MPELLEFCIYFLRALNNLETHHLLAMKPTRIFSHSVDCFLTGLITPSAMQKVFFIFYIFSCQFLESFSNSSYLFLYLKVFSLFSSGNFKAVFLHFEYTPCADQKTKGQFHSFVCVNPIFAVPFVEKDYYILYVFGSLVENQVAISVWVYFLVLCPINVSIFV